MVNGYSLFVTGYRIKNRFGFRVPNIRFWLAFELRLEHYTLTPKITKRIKKFIE